MATKDGKRMETMALRSTRRTKGAEFKQEKKLVPENAPEQPDEHDLHNQIEEHKEQQITPKNDKDTALPSNNQPQPLSIHEDTARRLTRSSALLPKKIISEPELPLDQVTPEDNPVRVDEEEPTCKKMVRVSSYAWLSEGGSPQLLGTARKGVSRVESVVSPYSEIRKSYRKIHRKEIVSIPYRKCHDAFQGRIVTIINKIESGKNCLRDFESLIDKIQRISPKDMINRYIVAGISTIARLTSHTHSHEPLHSRFHQEQSALKAKIEEELDRTDDFEHCLLTKNQQVIDSQQYRRLTIRRIYKLMKKRASHHNVREIRERVMKDCERHFTGETNVGSLVKFIRQKMEVMHE